MTSLATRLGVGERRMGAEYQYAVVAIKPLWKVVSGDTENGGGRLIIDFKVLIKVLSGKSSRGKRERRRAAE